jgi:excisionase family DNA binding protein
VGVEKDTTMQDDFRQSSKRPELDSQPSGSESTYRSVAALATDIGLSERSTRSALRRGEIPHIRVGRRFILPKAAIAEWLRTAGRSVEDERTAAYRDHRTKGVALAGHSEVTVMTRAIGHQ